MLRDVMFGNRRHFRELQAQSEEGIASNILSDRLKRLMTGGLLTRDDARPGQRATYSLTNDAIELVPVFAQLGAWGLGPGACGIARPAPPYECAPNCSKPVAQRCGVVSWTSSARHISASLARGLGAAPSPHASPRLMPTRNTPEPDRSPTRDYRLLKPAA